ncbi:racA [Physcia stellaris]|nr:racA [Physcia stellaris]
MRCSGFSSLVPNALPPLIRHQGLRRRASSDNVQVSARPQASARPGVVLVSVTLSHSVQRRSISASATASLIRSSRPTIIVGPVQTSSGVTPARTALPTEFDDVGFNDTVAPNGTSSSILHASRSFLPLAVHGRFLNGTGARTTFDTRYTATATIRAPSGGLGRNGTSDPANFNQSRPLQSLRSTSPAGASGTIYGSSKVIPTKTTGRLLLLPTGPLSEDSSSRSNISSFTSAVVALPSIVVLPPYDNATSKINGSSATNILRSTHNDIGFNYPVPTITNHDIWR